MGCGHKCSVGMEGELWVRSGVQVHLSAVLSVIPLPVFFFFNKIDVLMQV